MKGRKIRTSVIALAVAAALTPLAPAFSAQNRNPGSQQPPTAQQKQAQEKTRTYYGKIVKARNGKYALVIDAKKNMGYYLDDQEDALKYNQKKVLITGTVSTKTSILHVLKIKPAAH